MSRLTRVRSARLPVSIVSLGTFSAHCTNVQLLLLTHMLPPSQGSSIFKRFSQLGWAGWNDAPSWGGRWMQADDGMHFSMPPAPSAQIKQGKSLL